MDIKIPFKQYNRFLNRFGYELVEVGFIYNNLEAEMFVYDDLKKNLARCNSGVEVIGALLDDLAKESGKTIADSIKTAYNKL